MKLILYNNFSENNNINKSLVKVIELNGTLRESTSITNPSIMIELDVTSLKEDDYVVEDNQIYVIYNGEKITWNSYIYDYVLTSNYCYITEFKRYYFIADIISEGYNLWRLVMNVDVSMSFKNGILDLYAYVLRNENTYNVNINDDLISYEYNKSISYVVPTNLSAVTTLSPVTTLANTIISYLTDDTLYLSSGTPALDGLLGINSYTSGVNAKTQYLLGTGGLGNDIVKEVYKNDTLRGYIKSIVMYPYTIESLFDNSKTTIKIGSTDVTLTDTFKYPKYAPDRVLIAHFRVNRKYNTYRDFSPYTKYEFYIPYCTVVELSGESFLEDEIKIFYTVNYEDATSTAYIYNVTKNKILFSGNATLGVKVGLSSTNALENKDQKTALALNTALGLVGSALSVGVGVSSGNAYAVGTGLLSATSTVGNAITKANQLYDLGKIEISSGIDGLSSTQNVYIKCTEMTPINESDIISYYGKPLNQYVQLSTLSGFTQVGEVHLENFASANATEKQLIDTLLKDGIIL